MNRGLLILVAALICGCGGNETPLPVRFVQLTTDGAANLSPSFSPDGRHLAISRRHGTSFDVWVISTSADRSQDRPLTIDPRDDDAPAWSPDGAWIAYSRENQGDPDLYIQSSGGGEEKLVAHGIRPSWNRDSKSILFELFNFSNPDYHYHRGIATVSLTDTIPVLVSLPEGSFSSPAWARKSDRMAALRSLGEVGVTDVWVLPSAPAAPVQVTMSGSVRSWAWSPDGRYIAYTVWDGLFIVRLSDLKALKVDTSEIPGILRIFQPCWSPDGTTIAFSGTRTGLPEDSDIYLMQNVPTFLTQF